jgi:hypothetical protein
MLVVQHPNPGVSKAYATAVSKDDLSIDNLK